MRPTARRRLALAAAVVAVAALRWLTRPHGPDSYDAVGFVRAVDEFDLRKFQPHFPGYAVYVALCKLVRVPALVSAIASGLTGVALFRLAGDGRAAPGGDGRDATDGGARGGWVALALWAGALQPWLTGGAALADATAVAFAAGAFAALTWPGARAALVGAAAMALAIGTRVSYWPLALSFALVVVRLRPARERRAAVAGFAVATLAWLVPFVVAVGPAALVALGRTHLAGHFEDWGGSVVTRPDVVARAVAFARDLLYDGLWPSASALVAALVLAAALAWRGVARRTAIVAAVVAVPYALWALFAQNVLEQPRHLLPLVAAACAAVGRAVVTRPPLPSSSRSPQPSSSRSPLPSLLRLAAGVALAALAFAAAAPLVLRRPPPAAVVVAERVAARYPGRDEAIVFARRSARLMSAAVPSLHVQPADAVSDILGTLERLPRLPPHIFYVAEELAADDPRHSLTADDSLHFCRDPRVDRQSPCVTLRSYNLHP